MVVDKVLGRLAAGLVLVVGLAGAERAQAQSPPVAPVTVWSVPDIDHLPDDENGRLVRYGRSLVAATYAHVGPEVADASRRYAGNNLACRNCHLDEGRKKFGLLLVGAFVDYPRYSTRRGEEVSIEDRVNSCMTRSMNGRPLPAESREMQALVAYIRVLSNSLPKDAAVAGQGLQAMAELDRPADPARGAEVYRANCALCHGPGGEGVRRGVRGDALGYATPPLWGEDSFNDGAGMNRLITIANFVHDNMPNGTSWVMPRLAPEDAWDVAAFVVSQPRPRKADLAADFPDKLDKPVDTPYGPYADGLSESQHRYGPFAPIRAEVARLRAQSR